MARPTKYSLKLVDEICEIIATTNKGIAKILKENESFPSEKTFYNWLNDKKNESFLQLYARAKERQADRLVEEILTISDQSDKDTLQHENGAESANNEWISRSKLRVDSRKWLASKLLPKKYGDKLDMDITNSGDITIKVVREGNTNQAEEPPPGTTADSE